MNDTLFNSLVISGIVLAVLSAIVLILRRFSKHKGGKIVTLVFTFMLIGGIFLAVIPFTYVMNLTLKGGTSKTYDTSLEYAASEGNYQKVKDLLDEGHDPDEKYASDDTMGYTPLIHACAGGYEDVAKLLIEKGADVNAADAEGITPLHYAAMDSENTTKLLIKKKAKISAKDSSGYTPLHYAASAGNAKTAKLLVEAGADVNCEAYTKTTPIQSACSVRGEASAELLEYLIKKGADTTVKTEAGNDLIGLLDETEKDIIANLDENEFDKKKIESSYKEAKEMLKKYMKSSKGDKKK